jgi:DnaJ-domain-containing protein 1
MSRVQDPLAQLWDLLLDAAARQLGAALFGPGAARRSGSRKGKPGEFPRGLDAAIPKAYVALGVLPSAPRAVIEAAYRALAKDAHPDVGGSEARMRALNAAMTTIRKERGWKR